MLSLNRNFGNELACGDDILVIAAAAKGGGRLTPPLCLGTGNTLESPENLKKDEYLGPSPVNRKMPRAARPGDSQAPQTPCAWEVLGSCRRRCPGLWSSVSRWY